MTNKTQIKKDLSVLDNIADYFIELNKKICEFYPEFKKHTKDITKKEIVDLFSDKFFIEIKGDKILVERLETKPFDASKNNRYKHFFVGDYEIETNIDCKSVIKFIPFIITNL